METPTNTNEADGALDAAAPKANNYQQSAATQAAAVRNQASSLGHNTFRPDVYKVSEGYLN